VGGFTTDESRAAKDFPTDLFLPARSEIFSVQKFLVRKFVGRIFFYSKVKKPKNFPVES